MRHGGGNIQGAGRQTACKCALFHLIASKQIQVSLQKLTDFTYYYMDLDFPRRTGGFGNVGDTLPASCPGQ